MTNLINRATQDKYRNSFCNCWARRPHLWKNEDVCDCGEDRGMVNGKKHIEWLWEPPPTNNRGNVILSEDRKQVSFRPFVSGGSCIIKGDTPFVLDYHYYWEVKLLSETAMSNIMIGVGTEQVMRENSRELVSRLGCTPESYGLNYLGEARHGDYKNIKINYNGFCRGCIVGVRLDMWAGTLEYYINRIPQGILFRGLRKHTELYPMIYANGLNIGIRLIYASSCVASLFIEAGKILGLCLSEEVKAYLLAKSLKRDLDAMFWIYLPCDMDDIDGAWHNSLNLSQCTDIDKYQYLPISMTLNRRIPKRKFFK